MSRTVPLLALFAVVTLADCLGGLGPSGSSVDPTTTTTTPTTTETTQTATGTPRATTIQGTTTTQATTRATTTPTRTTARVDAPTGSQRFEARVTKIVDPTTVKIEHDGKTQTVDLIGVKVPKSGLMHQRALQTTQAQLEYSVVTIVTDPQVASDSDGHLQVYRLHRQLAV